MKQIETPPHSRNESLDTFRMLAALCVIIVHAEYSNLSSAIVAGAKFMSFWVIPFFFIISGYFLAEKTARTGTLDVRSTIERMGWVFLIWIIIYLPLEIWDDGLDALGVFDMATTPMFLYHGDYYHLWYMSSMALGCLFIAVCYRYNAKILIPIMSVAAIVISIIASGYDVLGLSSAVGTQIPKFWRSIPFLYLGFLIYRRGLPPWWISALLAVIGVVVQPLEVRFIYEQYGIQAYRELLVGSTLTGVGMACLALSNLRFLQVPLLSRLGREYALGVYLIHPIVIFLTGFVMFRFAPAIARSKIWQMALPLTLLFLCIAAMSAVKRYAPSVYNFLLGVRASSPQN